MLSNIRTFSPTVVNEFRFGWTQFGARSFRMGLRLQW